MTIKAEILLQGGHTVTIETRHGSVDEAAGKYKNELTGGWQSFGSQYLIHPGSVAAVRFYDDDVSYVDGVAVTTQSPVA